MKRLMVLSTVTLAGGLIAAVVGFSAFNSGKTGNSAPEITAGDYRKRAELYEEEGDYKEAIVVYEKAEQLEDADPEIIRGIAQDYMYLGAYTNAVDRYQQLMEADGATEDDMFNYISCMLGAGMLEEAKAAVEAEMSDSSRAEKYEQIYEQMVIPAPEFDLSEGSYPEYQMLHLIDSGLGFSVYYTEDGSIPTEGSAKYDDGIIISYPDSTIKAVAVSSLGYQSDVTELHYRITAPVVEIDPDEDDYSYRYNSLARDVRDNVLRKNGSEPVYNYELAKIRELYMIGSYGATTEHYNRVFYENAWSYSGSSKETSWGNKNCDALRYMPFLKTLAVCNQEGFDVSLLSDMRYLENLSLLNDHIQDISGLQSISSLKKLALGWNAIEDVSALRGLTDLESLGLWNNEIRDISSLSGLNRLSYFDISGNKVEDISVVGNMTGLTELWISGNPIRDRSVIDDLQYLTTLH